MISNGLQFLNVPYVAHTLEVNNDEELVINSDEVDCTTFVEYTLAMSLCPVVDGEISEIDFIDKVQALRYRNGKVDGYTSRLHYTTEWINHAIARGYLTDITALHSADTQTVSLSYMSSHPDLYKQLRTSPANVTKMKSIEQTLSGQVVHYLPKEKLPDNGFVWIKNGDMIAITTRIPGLDISHLGIAFYVRGTLCLLHASSAEKKVVVSKLSLSRMLKNNKNSTGIRVLRIKD
ncbi:MAG: DUF1460 domain-containing protein [Prevotellaceae bacterium]|nr:DUF1460 domain-containing protein [Prevotellaceae bacterium]